MMRNTDTQRLKTLFRQVFGEHLKFWAAIVLAVCAAFVFFLKFGGGWLIYADPLGKADLIVVMSGGEDRMAEAARLYNDRLAPLVLLTDTGQNLTGTTESNTLDARLRAVQLGIPIPAIEVTSSTVGSTREEATAVKKYMSLHNLKRCIVVTDPYHTRRTLWIFQNTFAGTEQSFIIRPVSDSWYQAGTWWKSFQGWQMTFNEYGKMAAYFLGIHNPF
jgi:uncharacterized SAM-binding protein YcdF (DUF218 family)